MLIDLNNVKQYLKLKHENEPEGIYIIGAKPYIAHTDKQGAIQFEITGTGTVYEIQWSDNDANQ